MLKFGDQLDAINCSLLFNFTCKMDEPPLEALIKRALFGMVILGGVGLVGDDQWLGLGSWFMWVRLSWEVPLKMHYSARDTEGPSYFSKDKIIS